MEERKEKTLDLTVIVPLLLKRWKLYAMCTAGAIIFSLIFVFTIPRYYACQVMLAPEASGDAGGMNSLLGAFGLGEVQTTNDAISPNLYPDLMTSKDFVVSMFSVEITTQDGKLTTTYYDYLLHHNKSAWYMTLMAKLTKALKSKKTDTSIKGVEGKEFSPSFMLTEEQYEIANAIEGKIKYDYNKKTGVVTVTVQDLDPLVCALLADTISSRLQDFILNYRTKKARKDLEYTQLIYAQTKAEYEECNNRYVAAVDANWDMVNETAKAKLEALNSEKTLKYQTFATTAQKLEAAKAKLQEATPVTTILQGASVPQKPAGPKRSIITMILIFLTCFVCTVCLVIKYQSEIRK